jgi:arabinogalactan oligomer/maltooligosaccharide transport system permease protein
MKMSRRQRVLTHTVLIIFAIWSVVPVIWTLLTSFKPESKIFSTQIKLIDDPTLQNYTDLLTRGDFVTWAINSLFVSLLSSIFAVFLASTCAYAISRFRFRGRSTSMYIFLVAQMFPAVILLIPLFGIFTNLKLIDTP